MKLFKKRIKQMSPEEARSHLTAGLPLSQLRRLSVQLKVNVGKKKETK